MSTRSSRSIVTAAVLMLAVAPLIGQAMVVPDGEPVAVREGDRDLLLATGPDGQAVLISTPAVGGAAQVDILNLSGARVGGWEVPGGANEDVLDCLWTDTGRIVLLRSEPGTGASDRRLVIEQLEPDGTEVAEAIVVSDHAQSEGALAEDAAGGLVVAWLELSTQSGGLDQELLLARYDPGGSLLLAPILVSREDQLGGSWISGPRIVPGPGLQLTVVYGHGDCGLLGCGTGIVGTRLDADGTRLPGHFTIGSSARSFAVAAVPGGEVAVAWSRPFPVAPGFDDGDGPFTVHTRRFGSAAGGTEAAVTSSPGSWARLSAMTPEIAVDELGAALVTWVDLGGAAASTDQIMVRSLDRDGTPSGSTLRLAIGTRAVVRAVAREHFLAAWVGERDGVTGVIVRPLRWVADPCTGQATALCLGNGRFEITAAWAAPDGQSGSGVAVPLTSDSGYFWFFNQSNVELVVKMLDACVDPYNRYWLFAAGLTDLEVHLSVRDLGSGIHQEYVNPLGLPFEPITDTATFDSCSPDT